MAFDLGEIKKHPYVVGGLVLVGGFVLYMLLSGSSSSGGSSDLSTVAAADSNAEQIAAASAAANAQVQQQQQATQLQAQVANNQVQAAYESQNNQTDAALVAALAQNDTVQQNQDLAAQVSEQSNANQTAVQQSELSTALQAQENNNLTSTQQLQSQLDYGTQVAQLQAGLQTTALNDYEDISQQVVNQQSQAQQYQYNLDSGILSSVQAAGLNHGTQSLENSLTAILSGIEGDPTVGTSAEQATALGDEAGNAASAANLNSILQAFKGAGSSVVSGLFA